MTIATPDILSIDLDKFNSVLCWFDLSTQAAGYRTMNG